MITGATTVFTGSSATGFALTDLMNWDEALPPRFQPKRLGHVHQLMANRIRRIDAGVTGGAGSSVSIQNLSLQTGSAGGPARNFLGYPAYQNGPCHHLHDRAAGRLLGDFSYYIIYDRIGMNIETIPHLFDVTNKPTGQRGLYAYWRNGAKVADASAFRTLKLG